VFPVFGFQDTITRWVLERSGGRWVPGVATGLAIADAEGRFLAGAAFTDFNGRNVSVHLVVDDKRAALSLFELIGAYAFEQLGCQRLTLIAETSNINAVRLHQKLGAIHEGTLVGAGKCGDNILVSRLTPESEIWRRLKRRRERKLQRGPKPNQE
jgi:RimJ/RimL family protein N-acetyltransferase